eukprot:CAMPEP_0176099252 /NCGR_PEP_ID=MMETSP0120_2-20121206/49773_1 /TAXON_ID=160619 /ORGANISM="Kryptoperidinium foliaceum, Strain CCMP 1326" /LENGTH=57 /DNA_ID=CAMNT_0017433279 /DNA_START=352 /DNA_END=522 /DNA_ORIENTATION=-
MGWKSAPDMSGLAPKSPSVLAAGLTTSLVGCTPGPHKQQFGSQPQFTGATLAVQYCW